VKRIGRYSERFQPSGGMGAHAARRAMGAARVGFWELFLRETLQNSWDARRGPDGPISYGVHTWTTNGAQRAFLRDVILADTPPHSSLPDLLADNALAVMVVADSGTKGLTGATRADTDPKKAADGHTDFVDLVRDIGRRAERGLAGGTYGFGKAVLAEASAASTVVIYSRTTFQGKALSRLIAMAVGNDEYTHRNVRYTGRHWWGIVERDVAEPLQGADADAAATALGMGRLISEPTGTAIMVIAPRTPDIEEGTDLAGIVSQIAEALVEYAWPHMVPGSDGRPSIDFSVTLEGRSLPLRGPAVDERLGAFAKAYAQCTQLLDGTALEGDDWPSHRRMLRSARPKRQLGPLVWRQEGTIGQQPAGHNAQSEVALMRSPRFVVSYMDVPRHPSGQSTYGVFIAHPELDHEFATAEPPTHDAWVPTPGRRGDPVNRSLKQIAEEIRIRPLAAASLSGSVEPGVVRVASALGGLLDGQHGGGDPSVPLHPPTPIPRPRPGETGNGGSGSDGGGLSGTQAHGSGQNPGRSTGTGHPDPGGHPGDNGQPHPLPPPEPPLRPGRPPRVQLDGQPRLVIHLGGTAVEFPLVVQKPPGYGDLRIMARPDVFVDGGRETEPPAGADMPAVLGWRDLSDGTVSGEQNLTVTADGVSRWVVVVSQPADAAVSVALSVVGRP
jgi:hypothetical protein